MKAFLYSPSLSTTKNISMNNWAMV